MAISFGGKAKEDDVVSLIAAKKYARAIEVLKAQLQRRGANPSLRMQLADVLLLADKKREAVALLLPLADQFATEGFAAKAVSVLKKVQKIDPGRRDVEARLARLIEEKQREAVVVPTRAPVIGLEETADEGPGAPADNPALEIGMEAMAPVSAPAAAAPAAEPVVAVGPVVAAELVVAEPILEPLPEAPAVGAPVPPEPSPFPPAASLSAPPPPSAVAPPPAAPPPVNPAPSAPPVATAPEIEDYDLLYTDDEEDEEEVALEAEIVEEGAPAAEPMSAGQFADELMGLVDSVFQEFPGLQTSPPVAAGAPPAQARQIVVSPLFRDFSVDEMVAVIEGLKLLSFERGEVILKQGQPGSSLYMLTSGRVRAFRKNPATGVQDVLGDLKEGAFFGEVSILTGRPRMASIVALTRCELLELDRPTLDEITRSHPRVWDVLREFAKQRGG